MRTAAFIAVLMALCIVPVMASDAPKLEPLVGVPPHPPDNPPTIEKIKLGETLFFDEILSGGNRRSCFTCHKPQLLFMDGFSRGWGLDDILLPRKTPGLMNVGWQRTMFFDGRVKTLEEQVPEPLKNHREMRMTPTEAA
jgi:cytochrome c peroxidase